MTNAIEWIFINSLRCIKVRLFWFEVSTDNVDTNLDRSAGAGLVDGFIDKTQLFNSIFAQKPLTDFWLYE